MRASNLIVLSFVMLSKTASAAGSDDADYAALANHQAAWRQASYGAAPTMPHGLAVTGLAPFTARDALLMELPGGASGETRTVLLVGDVDGLHESLLIGDLRGASILSIGLTAGAQALDGDPVTLYDLNAGAEPAPDTHAGTGSLRRFDKDCAPASCGEVRSGYVALSPTADADRVRVRLALGWNAGETLSGELTARWVPRLAHVRDAQGPTCSPAFSALSK